ncbi:hypothetical protein BJ170DRAFT_234301 [Xylariales sp. AK1849]|nr:hypothetical protein BJ170DRAFT_234301 [Xylariales sp. AK1849]
MDTRPSGPNGDVGNQPSPDKENSKEKQRSRTGCRTCRSRKVKCDERPGGCLNCAKLNLPCPNRPEYHKQHSPVEDASRTQAGLRRLRTYRSCKNCRSSKTRCSGERPVCLRCRHKKVGCLYDGKQAPAWVDSVTSETEGCHGSRTEGENALQALTPAGTLAERQSSRPAVPNTSDEDSCRTIPAQVDQGYCPRAFSWLMSPDLPDKDKIILLVEEFFSNVHNLRCFGFIHKPSYMQQLDDRSQTIQRENALLHIVCAMGSKFYALKCSDQLTLPDDFALQVGNQWASRAKGMLFTNMNNISVQNTMAVVLVHEHDLRIGDYASAFMLTGLGVRMAQALQINLEKSPNILSSDGQLHWSSREARRRLMWSIYIMDAWVGSGVDELTLVRDQDMKIQLPCNERNFMLQIPCLVETLQTGEYLPFVSLEDRAKGPTDTLDLQAQFIRLLCLRRKVLRYVKHLDTALPPWLPGSEFSRLETDLFLWYEQLPNSLQYTRTAIYMRKESSQLGALLLLHWTYHQSLCDLNRIGMRELFRIRCAIAFPPEQVKFQAWVQDRCMEHATGISLIFEEALRHGPEAFADTWLPVIAHDSIRVIVHYVARLLGTVKDKLTLIRPHAILCIQANIAALKKMMPMFQLAKPLHTAASNLLRREGFDLAELAEVPPLPTSDTITQDNDVPVTLELPPQFTPEYILNPLAIYRMARRDIQDQEKHAPERSSSATSIARAAEETTPNEPPQVVPMLPGLTPSLGPGDLQPHYWWGSENVSDNTDAIANDFQLPSSFDNLQAYFPLMYNNFSLPMQGTVGDSEPSANVSGIGEAAASSYPPPLCDGGQTFL